MKAFNQHPEESSENKQVSEAVIQQKIEDVKNIVEKSPFFSEFVENKAYLRRDEIGENEAEKKKWKDDFVQKLLMDVHHVVNVDPRDADGDLVQYVTGLSAEHYNLEYNIKKLETQLADLKKATEPKIKALKEEYDALYGILVDKPVENK